MSTRKTTLEQGFLALAALAAIWGGLALWPCPAAACPMTSTSLTGITIRVGDGQDAGEMTWLLQPSQTVADRYVWSLSEPVAITGGGRVLATVTALGVDVDVDPGVSLGFEVTAGNADTEFTITSATLTFTPLYNIMAFASAGVTVTDANTDGATLTGLFGDGHAYEARYNSSPVTWAKLLGNPVVAGTDDTLTVNDRRPATSREAIPGTLSSIQSEWHFKVSAYDTASGTSRFDVIGTEVPEPATLVLLALGGMGILIGRRRK